MKKQPDSSVPALGELADFLADYSSRLFAAGATCIRLEKNVERIAGAYGADVELAILPRHIHILLRHRASGERDVVVTGVGAPSISYNVNTRLSALSWEIADGRIGFAEARRKFGDILSSDTQSRWLVLVLVTLANASFCRLFGGDASAMAIVAVATMAGYYLKQLLMEHRVDARVMVLSCSFVSAVLGATGALFGLGATPGVALGTSVLYLVPGIPFLNSFSDMLNRHYLCALGRFADAAVLTCCLSAGLCVAMLMMNTGMF